MWSILGNTYIQKAERREEVRFLTQFINAANIRRHSKIITCVCLVYKSYSEGLSCWLFGNVQTGLQL